MSAIVLVDGIVRGRRELTARASGEVFGTEVSLMTQVGDALGETLKVLFFDREGVVVPAPGARVSVVVEVDAGRYGLGGTFQRYATADDTAGMPFTTPTLAFSESSKK